jgi:hypothetical protein
LSLIPSRKFSDQPKSELRERLGEHRYRRCKLPDLMADVRHSLAKIERVVGTGWFRRLPR